jgi:hypothetical protein
VHVAVALAGVLLVSLAAGVAISAAGDADWTGHWSIVDHCTGGGCSGQTYYWEPDFVQTGATLTGTGVYTVQGTVSGASATFTASGYGGYVAQFHVTMSSDGKSLSGTATDNLGQSFTITGSGSGKPATTTPTTTTPTTTTPTSPTVPGSELPPLPPATNPTARLQSMLSVGPKGSKPSLKVRRGGKDYAASENSTLQNGDVLTTDDHTIAALDFLIGGRVGINKDTNVVMVNERAVGDGDNGLKRAILKNGSLWLKADAKAPSAKAVVGEVAALGGSKRLSVRQASGGALRRLKTDGKLRLGDHIVMGSGVTATLLVTRPKGISTDTDLIELAPATGARHDVAVSRKGTHTTIKITPAG